MKKMMFLMITFLCFSSAALYAQNDQMQMKNNNTENEEFVKKAVSGGKMEVELGKMVQDKAASEEVKEFAMRMVEDHQKANEELMSILNDANLDVPKDEMMDEHKQIVSDLSSRYGVDLDRAYMKVMVEDHTEDVEAFEKASKNHENESIRAWASKTLPVLKEHLELARQINKMLGVAEQ